MQKLNFFGRNFEPSVRTLGELKEVAYDKAWIARADLNTGLYYMYREVYRTEQDLSQMRKSNIRYDITIIPPRQLGKEFVKTLGHYHPLIGNTRFSYPEIYEVLEGEAHFVLQKETSGREIDGRLEDVVVVKMVQGDVVVIPPNYGHVIINASSKPLKTADLSADDFASEYEPFKARHGAAYFRLVDGQWVKNENYDFLPELRFINMKSQNILENDIYNLVKTPKKLEFLTQPWKFLDLFSWIKTPEANISKY